MGILQSDMKKLQKTMAAHETALTNIQNLFLSMEEMFVKCCDGGKDLQGIELKSYPLAQTGANTIVVNGSELPAGMYLYTLVADNEIIDTKRMILTK